MIELQKLVELGKRIKRIAQLPITHLLLVCDGCGACYPDNDASDQESCDVCGRFKQRMEWAAPVDVARDAAKLAAAAQQLIDIGKLVSAQDALIEHLEHCVECASGVYDCHQYGQLKAAVAEARAITQLANPDCR